VDNAPRGSKKPNPRHHLTRGLGVAGVALAPERAAFRAAASRKAEHDQAEKGGEAPMHKNSLADRGRACERPVLGRALVKHPVRDVGSIAALAANADIRCSGWRAG
jgi:hypothetical protein